MSSRIESRGRDWDESGRHPIAWFSALMRGIDQRDLRLVDRAQAELERLGYFVVPFPPADRERGEGHQ